MSTFLASVAIASGVAWFVAGRVEPAVAPPVRFTIGFDTGGDAWRDLTDRPFVISPDGRAVVYRATTRGLPRLYIRTLDQLEPRPLVAGALVRTPFFSPDSQWVAFFEGATLKKVPVSGGPPVEIARITGGGAFGASWGDDGSIVFGSRIPGRETGIPLMLVPASGGEPIALTTVDPGSENADTFPVWLPQSRGVLFRMYIAIRPASSETRLMLLDRATGERREIAAAVSGADFVAGRIVYADPQGQLYGLPFDPSTLTALGPATALAERVHVPPVGQAMFSAAFSGALAFLPALDGPGAERGRSLVWVDRQGREEPLAAPPRAYAVPRLSPDGTPVALDIRDEDSDIWIRSLDRGVMTRLTSGPTLDMAPVWTPDGRRIIWTSTRDAANPTLYWQAADGTGAAERLNGPGIAFPGSVTPDGKAVLSWGAAAVNSSGAAAGIFRTALFGERSLDRVLGPMQGVLTPEVSSDGRWLAYESNESGQPEIYVRPYPNVDDGRWQISTERGSRPAWSRNGRELFFLDGTDRLSVASIAVSGNTLAPGAPRRLLESAYYPGFSSRGVNLRGYDVSLDGQRFLMIKGPADAAASQTVLTVVSNWRAH
ncbi:MAG: PD40 domain-containing protein [Acidobacteria bacterium]|nr:PD40 domain-containing protein [Acidobacteriota bacterium]